MRHETLPGSRGAAATGSWSLLPRRGTQAGPLARFWVLLLAIAVTLTLIAYVQVADPGPAKAAPPEITGTTPPKVTDPKNIRRIGFPVSSPRVNPGGADGWFDAVEIPGYRGHWIARIRHPQAPDGRIAPFADWPEPYTDSEWQKYVDGFTAELDRLASSKAGKTTIKVAGSLKPEPGGTGATA